MISVSDESDNCLAEDLPSIVGSYIIVSLPPKDPLMLELSQSPEASHLVSLCKLLL